MYVWTCPHKLLIKIGTIIMKGLSASPTIYILAMYTNQNQRNIFKKPVYIVYKLGAGIICRPISYIFGN